MGPPSQDDRTGGSPGGLPPVIHRAPVARWGPPGEGGRGAAVRQRRAATAATTSTRPWPLSYDVVPSGPASYAAPSAYLWAETLSARSMSAGVAPGAAWKSWATMP